MPLTVVIDPHLFDADYLSIDSNRQQLQVVLYTLRTARIASTHNLKDSYRERKAFLRSLDQNKVKRIMTLLEERLLKPKSVPLDSLGSAAPHQGCRDLQALGDQELADWVLAREPGCSLAGDVTILRRVTPESMGDSRLLDELERATRPLKSFVVNGNEPEAVDKLQGHIEQLVDGRGWTTIIDPYMASPRRRHDGGWEGQQGPSWKLSLTWLIERVRAAGKAERNVPTLTFVSKTPGPGSEPFDYAAWLTRFQLFCKGQAGINVRFLIRLVARMSDDRAHGRWMLTTNRNVQVDQGFQLVVPRYGGRLVAPSRAITIEEKTPDFAMDTLAIDLKEIDGTSYSWVTADGVRHVPSRAELRQLVVSDGMVMTPRFAHLIFGGA